MTTKKFEELYFFHPKSKLQAGEGMDEGRYPFYTSSATLKKRINESNFNTQALIFGTGGSPSIHYANGQFNVSTDCLVASSKQQEVNIKYAYYYLAYNIHILERGFKGAGLKHISKSYIGNILITYPDPETQNKIVTILDKANSLIKKREETIAKYDELLRATFLEMFGDPVKNDRKWKMQPLSSFGKIITGNTPSRSNKAFYNENYIEWIKTNNIIKGQTHITIAEEFLSERGFEVSRWVEPNSLLVACIAGSIDSIGRTGITNRRVAFNQQINAIVPEKEVSVFFLYWLVTISNKYIQSFATKGMKRLLTKGVFEKIKFIKPEYKLQQDFEKIAIKSDILKRNITESKLQLEFLINTLLEFAFKGELTFNTAVDLEVLLENDYDFFKANSSAQTIRLLLERLDKAEGNDKKIYEEATYHKAKGFVFGLLQEGRIKQILDNESKTVKLALA